MILGSNPELFLVASPRILYGFFSNFLTMKQTTITRRELIKQGGLALLTTALPVQLQAVTKNTMNKEKETDVIIIGGSYAGLSAAMALARAHRRVTIIDAGKPCNRQTPHAHNLLTHDGDKPADIAALAKEQVMKYKTVSYFGDKVIAVKKTSVGFSAETEIGSVFNARKIIIATGIKDKFPPINGFAECWGISVLHCPYCHGYEVSNTPIGIIANGDIAWHFAPLISQWTDKLSLFTNGKSELNAEQTKKLKEHNIAIHEKAITDIVHKNGYLERLVFEDGSTQALTALFARPGIAMHTTIHEQLGCELNDMGLIKTDPFQKTNVHGVYAAGDCASPMRSLSVAIAAGNVAGAVVNKELIDEAFM